jgi:protein TonB
MRGWEGEVRLRLRVARKGALLAVSVERSSGFEVLDQHALALVEQLRGLPPLPEEIGAGEVQVVVPVSYRLKGPT